MASEFEARLADRPTWADIRQLFVTALGPPDVINASAAVCRIIENRKRERRRHTTDIPVPTKLFNDVDTLNDAVPESPVALAARNVRLRRMLARFRQTYQDEFARHGHSNYQITPDWIVLCREYDQMVAKEDDDPNQRM